jgi:lipoate-protein ligase A
VAVLTRRAGGGAVWLDQHMLCGAICVPTASLPTDLTESYRWLGDQLVTRLRSLGVADARRVEVAEARASVAALRARADPLAALVQSTCYGACSPHEVLIGDKKLVGLAQIRRRQATLFQIGVLLHDQSPLAAFLNVPDEHLRQALSAELTQRTVGLASLTSQAAAAVAAVIAGARPSAL